VTVMAGIPAAAPSEVPIPVGHRDLLQRDVVGVLTTLLPDGQPHSALVWVGLADGLACVNTTLERRSGRNLLVDPRVSLLVVDPDDTSRFLQVRGVAELITDGAEGQLDRLTRRYTGHPAYYGWIAPVEQRERETRVIGRIHARRVTLDAIHR
jgi:PPOX class probable F420-dependent enzyme